MFEVGTNTTGTGLVDRDAGVASLEANPNLASDFAWGSVAVSPLPITSDHGQRLQFTVSKVAGIGGVPGGAKGAMLNITAILKLGTSGKFCLQTGETAAQLIIDVTAYL